MNIYLINNFNKKKTLNETGCLKPKFYWIGKILGSYEPGVLPARCVLVFTISSSCIFAILQWGGEAVFAPTWWSVILLSSLTAISLISKIFKNFKNELLPIFFFIYKAIGVIAAHQQSTEGLRFKVPWVPFIPALSIIANVALMVNLNPMTWIRFLVWIIVGNMLNIIHRLVFKCSNICFFYSLGLIIYFTYGMRNSKENTTVTSYSGLLDKSGSSRSGDWGSTLTSKDLPTTPPSSQTELN